jgi:hypothetical protein
MRNEIMESVVRGEYAADRLEDWKKQRRLREKQRFAYDTGPDVYNNLADDEVAGVMELGVLNQVNGQVDTGLTGSVIIGGKQMKLDEGKLRIVDKKAVDTAIIPILEERAYKDTILSAILADRSGKIARLILPKQRYDLLVKGADLVTGLKLPAGSKVPEDVKQTDARPEFFSMYPDSSAQFALAVHKMNFILDRTQLAFSEEINDWVQKYNMGDASRAVGAGRVA